MKNADIIFKNYDIRGKYPHELDEKVAEEVGRSVCIYISGKLRKKYPTFVICRDGRGSSESLKEALVKGIIQQGGNIFDAGLGTTSFFYFLVRRLKADGGVMVTASHNPFPYNGFKIRSRDNKPVSMGRGLEVLKKIYLSFKQSSGYVGKVLPYKDYGGNYLNFLAKGIKIQSLKVVLDAGGGSAAVFLPRLLSKFGKIAYKPIFFELDGTFRNHSPNPLLPEAQQFIRKELSSRKFHFGAIFDGDGDRVVFFDEIGNPVRAEYIFAIFAAEELKKRKNLSFVMSVNSSKAVREYIKEKGGRVRLSRVGYTSILEAMRRSQAVLGVEVSGHFYFSKINFETSGLLPWLHLASIISKSQEPLSRMIKPFERYVSSGTSEIIFEVADKKKVMTRVQNFYRNARHNLLDGLTIEFFDWWFNLRPSNTEPVMRLVVEAENEGLFKEKVEELTNLIKGT